MTKIKDYSLDTTVSKEDKLIGTDSTDNSTKTFSVTSLSSFVNKDSLGIHAVSGTSISIPVNTSRVIVLTESSGDITLNLHTAVDNSGIVYHILIPNDNNVTIDPNSTEKIDGASTKLISSGGNGYYTIIAYNGAWYTLNS